MARAPSRYRSGFLTRHRAHLVSGTLVGLILVVAFALFVQESRQPIVAAPEPQGGELRVWFLDIGQGDATLIETPNGEQILVDGGPGDAVLTKLGQIMSPLDRTIDAVVATHPDADHISGLIPVLERYDVREVMYNGDVHDTQTTDAFVAAREAEPNAERPTVRVGDVFTFGDVTLTAVWPTDAAVANADTNTGSIVFLLTYGDTSVLLTGDAPEEAEQGFEDAVGDIDVLKVGHHGSVYSSSVAFLEIARPEIAVISVGAHNRYGHPSPVVMARLDEEGIPYFRTDRDGDILLTSTGGEPTVRPSPLPF